MHFECLRCKNKIRMQFPVYRCECGGNLWLELDYDELSKSVAWPGAEEILREGVFAFGQLLPSGHTASPYRHLIGPTALLTDRDVAQQLGLRELWIKDDTRLPSCSFKDRGSSVVVALAKKMGLGEVTTASTGNAGCSMACLCADLGLPCTVFVPAKAPVAKVQQLQIYGARVVKVEGTYDDAFELSFEVSQRMGWLNRSTGWNPMTREGKKSVSFELAWQLGREVPDVVLVSTGDGNILSGVYKGFYDLLKMGWINRVPRLVAVQSSQSRAIAAAWERRRAGASLEECVVAVEATTLADSISVGFPRDADGALRALEESDGWVQEVEDSEILAAVRELASKWALFAEPAGAAAYAGLLRGLREGRIASGSSVAVLVTGNGLKDPKAALEGLVAPLSVPNDVGAAMRALEGAARRV